MLYKIQINLNQVHISDRKRSDIIMARMKTSLVCLLLTCLLPMFSGRPGGQALRPRIQREVKGSRTHKTDISLLNGYIPDEVECTVVNTCTGLKEQLEEKTRQLQKKIQSTIQLEQNLYTLQATVRKMNSKSGTCTVDISGQTDDPQSDLEVKMRQLEQISNDKGILVLRITSLTNDVNDLQNTISLTSTPTEINDLRMELEETERLLKIQKEEIEKNSVNSKLVLEIIKLQTQIWELQKKNRTEEIVNKIAVLQGQLDPKINELQSNPKEIDNTEIVIMIITLGSEVAELQIRITEVTENSQTKMTYLERQLADLRNQLIEKILALPEDSTNMELTEEILVLQSKINNYLGQKSNRIKTTNDQISVLQNNLNIKEKLLVSWKGKVKAEEGEDAYTQLLVQIISKMREQRAFQVPKKIERPKTAEQFNELLKQVESKKKEIVQLQAENQELQQTLEAEQEETTRCLAQKKKIEKELSDKHAHCSELRNRYDNLQRTLETKLNEMVEEKGYSNKLILEVWSLTNEVTDLKTRTTTIPEEVNEIQELLKEKSKELTTKTDQLEKNTPQPKNILRIIEIYNEIFNLQKGLTNENTYNRISEFQAELDKLIATIQDKDNGNCKLILQIITLQNQVTRLQRQTFEYNQTSAAKIAELESQLEKTRQQLNEKTQMLNVTVNAIPKLNLVIMDLRNKLTGIEVTLSDLKQTSANKIEELQNLMEQKRDELEDKTTELRVVNAKNAESMLTIIELQQQMKGLRGEESQAKDKAEAVITGLQEQLMAKKEESARCQVQNKLLEKKLIDKEGGCSVTEQKYNNLQTEQAELLDKLQTANGGSDKLLLEVWTLNGEVSNLKKKLESSTENADKIRVTLAEKIKQLEIKTEELKKNVPQQKNILRIIAIQDNILSLQEGVTNETTCNQIAELEKELEEMVALLQGKNNGNSKIILQIITLQNQVTRLQKQQLQLNQTFEARILEENELENELQQIRDALNEKKRQLKQSSSDISKLSAEIMNLRNNQVNLETKLSALKQVNEDSIEDLQSLLEEKSNQLKEKTTELKAVDSENAKNILKIVELEKEIKKINEEGSNASDKQILELNKKMKAKTMENLRLESKNKELEKIQRETKNTCDEIMSRCNEVSQQNNQIKMDWNKLQQQLQQIEEQFHNLTLTLKDKEEENAGLQMEKEILQETVTGLQQEITIIKAGPTASPTPKVDPDTVVRSFKVALDPGTAHTKVILSADGTRMTLSMRRQNIVDSPDRYDLAIAALGKTGINKGKHYWEVSCRPVQNVQ
ncbi:hypothetical protein DPEC_G00061690 [Dallia pectoralis]|uniref:Uncharacterized protein n=1 Tax=Dallia pectoralis TaxID=75939 RepID=A0ACC2H8A7_DALPE|nr:hypothetical protein DPEC_G00061690 [Dallia pectoralis]